MSYTCDSCVEKIRGTVTFCPTCAKYLCEGCTQTIHNFKSFRNHKVEVIEPTAAISTEEDSRSNDSKTLSEVCPHHSNALLRLFCEDCKELCCYQCICNGGEHSKHKVTPYRDAYEKKKAAMESMSSDISRMLSPAALEKELLESEVSGCRRNKGEVDKEITDSLGIVSTAVHNRSAELSNSISAEIGAAEEEIKTLLACTRKLRAEMNVSITKLSEMNGECVDRFLYVKEAERIKRIAAELKAKNAELVDKITANKRTVEFIPNANVSGTVQSTEAFTTKIATFGTLERSIAKSTVSGKGVFKVKPSRIVDKTSDKPKTTTNFHIQWGNTIAQALAGVVKRNENAVYVLEHTTQDIKGCRDAEIEYRPIYQGKDSEFTLEGSNGSSSRRWVRLCVGTRDSAYTLWKSDPQFLSASGGTYDGVFRPNETAKFSDGNMRIVRSAGASVSSRRVNALGTKPLEVGSVSVFYVRVIETKTNDNGTSVGVAPMDAPVNSRQDIRDMCGWYMNFFNTRLFSGLPTKTTAKDYGRRNDVKAGDIIRVTFDATGPQGILSFAINGKNLGVGFDNIPLDEPVAPMVHIYGSRETIELCDLDLELPEEWDNEEESN